MPSIFNDVVEIIPITAVLACGTVLGDASSHIMLRQAAIWTGQWRSLTSGMPCLIIVAG
jgi:hypothetical protein